jgi:hypothetical protein
MHKHDTGGPLIFPHPPPDVATSVVLTEKLRGHVTSSRWLPEGLSPELDELRGEQLSRRERLASDLERLHDLVVGFQSEDSSYTEALRQAARDNTAPPEDHRTPHSQRQEQRAKLEERIWAGAVVFGELVDRVTSTCACSFRERLRSESVNA